jgi:hypothetical protein
MGYFSNLVIQTHMQLAEVSSTASEAISWDSFIPLHDRAIKVINLLCDLLIALSQHISLNFNQVREMLKTPMPVAGVLLHVYLYRHQALLSPEPQPLSQGVLQMQLRALYASSGSEAEP